MLLQGATNLVAQFVRIVTKILKDLILKDYLPFLDDIGVKGLLFAYNNKEALLGIKQFVIEHVQTLNRTLIQLKRASCTISLKLQFYIDRIKIVGFICRVEGKTLNSVKVIKIFKWKPYTDIREARAFIRVCVYYQI